MAQIRTVAFMGLVAAATCVALPSDAQGSIVCRLGPAGGYDVRYDQAPTEDAMSIARDVAMALCDGPCGVDLVRNVTAGNAITFASYGGTAKIAYSPDFLTAVDANYGDSAVFGVFAHEVGHVKDARQPVVPMWMDSSWSRELRADAWAGCAMARAGLDTSGLRAALLAIAAYPSPTHPAWPMRWRALDTGFQGCGGGAHLPR